MAVNSSSGRKATCTRRACRVEWQSFTPGGAPVDCPSGPRAGTNVLPGGPDMAIDPADDHIFVQEGSEIAEYSSFCAATASAKMPYLAARAMGVSPSTHELYLARGDDEGGIFLPNVILGLVPLPTATTGTASAITRSSATLEGSVNLEGAEVTACEFEYGSTGAYGHTEPCEQPLPLEGSGRDPGERQDHGVQSPGSVAVLPPESTAFGSSPVFASPAGESLNLESFPPPVVGGAGRVGHDAVLERAERHARGQRSARRLPFRVRAHAGRAALKDARRAPTARWCRCPRGYTPPSAETVTVSQPVDGLTAGTSYHYRLVASSPGGTDVQGPEETFTTAAIPAPSVSHGRLK